MPTSAPAAAMRRSAAAMSGRRSSRSDGSPIGISGGGLVSGDEGSCRADGGLPVSTAIACSSAARRRRGRPPAARGRLELRLGQRDVRLRGDPAGEPVLRQLERALEGGDGVVEDHALGVEPAQLEVVERELGVQRQPHRLEIRGARLGGRARRTPTPSRTRPHTSASYDTSTGSRKSETRSCAVASVRLPDSVPVVICGVVVICG